MVKLWWIISPWLWLNNVHYVNCLKNIMYLCFYSYQFYETKRKTFGCLYQLGADKTETSITFRWIKTGGIRVTSNGEVISNPILFKRDLCLSHWERPNWLWSDCYIQVPYFSTAILWLDKPLRKCLTFPLLTSWFLVQSDTVITAPFGHHTHFFTIRRLSKSNILHLGTGKEILQSQNREKRLFWVC